MNSPQHSVRTALVGALLAGVTLLLYWPVSGHQFIDFDDNLYVTENPQVNGGLGISAILWAFTSVGYASNWHPLTWLSHMLDVSLFGLRPGAHHLVNVCLHMLNTVLLQWLLTRMTGAFWRSALVAALFAWHPLHVESVAWVAERKDVLSTLFWLLTIGAYHRYTQHPQGGARKWVVVLFTLGLLAKPMLVTLPCVLLLLDVWPLKRLELWPEGVRWPRFQWAAWCPLVREKLPLFGLAVAASVVTFVAQRIGGSVAQVLHYPLPERLTNVVVAYATYLVKMVAPTPLAVFYPLTPNWPWWEVLSSAVLLIGITAAVLGFSSRRPYLLVGWLWYLGTLVPVIGLVQVGAQAYADRYTYIPLLGIFIGLAWWLADLAADRRWLRPVLAVAGVASLIGCVVATARYLPRWRDSITLFEHALSVTRANPIAHTVLGNAYDHLAAASTGEAQKRHYAAAILHYNAGLRMNPDFADGHFNLGDVLVRVGELEAAEGQFRMALRLKPKQPDAYNNLGYVLAARKLYPDALTNYQYALKLLPNYTNAHNNMAVTLEKLGRYDEAMTHYESALKLDPKLAAAHANYALLLARQARMAEALPHFAEVARQQPNDAQARFHLGLGLLAEQQAAAALGHLRAAVELRPDWLPALHALAWTLATHRDDRVRNGPDALRLATRACELTGNADATQLDTLAAAQAETGSFAEAIPTAERALAAAAGNPELATDIQKRLTLYRQNQPYRDARQ